MEGFDEEELEKSHDLRESRESLLHCVQFIFLFFDKFQKSIKKCIDLGLLRSGVQFYSGIINEHVELADCAKGLGYQSKIYIKWMDKFGPSIVRGREDAEKLLVIAKMYCDEFFVAQEFKGDTANKLLSHAELFIRTAKEFPGMYEVSPRKVALDGYVAGAIWRHNGIEVNCGIPEKVVEVMAEAARRGPGATIQIKSDVPKNVQADIRKAHQVIAEQTGKTLDWHVKSCLKKGNYAVTVHVGPFPPKKSGPKAKPNPKKKTKTTSKTKKPKK